MKSIYVTSMVYEGKGNWYKKRKKKTHNINTKNLKGNIIIDGTFIKMIFNDIMKTSFNVWKFRWKQLENKIY